MYYNLTTPEKASWPSPSLPSEEAVQAKALEAREIVEKALRHWEEIDDWRVKEILQKYSETLLISPGVLKWLKDISAFWTEAQPLYGDFKSLFVMFMIAGESLKKPKVRLITKEGLFIQLNFDVQAKRIHLFQGGWAGHGERRKIGYISNGVIQPHYSGAISEDILLTLQEFSLNPAAVALASAQRLGACSFCGTRLSDEESKRRGYGPICAEHYHLPWGDISEETLIERRRVLDLDPEDLI